MVTYLASYPQIPDGWYVLARCSDYARAGDKYWSEAHRAWLPIVTNEPLDGKPIREFVVLIRKVG
jgi:hypothetical protein